MRDKIENIIMLEDNSQDKIDQICSLIDDKLSDIFHAENPLEEIDKLRKEIKGE